MSIAVIRFPMNAWSANTWKDTGFQHSSVSKLRLRPGRVRNYRKTTFLGFPDVTMLFLYLLQFYIHKVLKKCGKSEEKCLPEKWPLTSPGKAWQNESWLYKVHCTGQATWLPTLEVEDIQFLETWQEQVQPGEGGEADITMYFGDHIRPHVPIVTRIHWCAGAREACQLNIPNFVDPKSCKRRQIRWFKASTRLDTVCHKSNCDASRFPDIIPVSVCLRRDEYLESVSMHSSATMPPIIVSRSSLLTL